MFRKAVELLKRFTRNKKGSSEIVGIVLILLFIVLVAAKPIKNLGATIANGLTQLNTEMTSELGAGD